MKRNGAKKNIKKWLTNYIVHNIIWTKVRKVFEVTIWEKHTNNYY